MSADDSRFVVFLDGFPRFWGGSREEASERYCEGREQLLSEPTEIRIQEVDGDLHCPAVAWHAEPLVFEDDGWVGCPECGRVRRGPA